MTAASTAEASAAAVARSGGRVDRPANRLADQRPDPGARWEFTVRISHFLTPEGQDATHYFFAFARDFARGDETVTEFMEKGALQAFYEDVDALESIAEVKRLEHGAPFQEINVKSDQAGVAARRILRRMADAEAGA